MAVRDDVAGANDSDWIGWRSERVLSESIQERAPFSVTIFAAIGFESDANAVLPGRELELK
jgi:hypothetical protein